MIRLLLAVMAACGTYLVYTELALGQRGFRSLGRSARRSPSLHMRVQQWMLQAGLDEVRPMEFGAVVIALFVVGATLAFALFGGLFPALIAGAFAGTFPVASYRARRDRRRAEARDAWPRMIEEIRLLTGSVGRSIPQALFEVGRRGPIELRAGFAAAEREWLITTDFMRTVAVLKARLADPTADAACETLLVAHQIGGTDIDRRLAALAEDRIQDLQGRKDAVSKQAGVRFARRFVLIVPVGMSLAGLSIGTGRAAYQTGLGQVAVGIGMFAVVACWMWAGRLMRLPEEARVFDVEVARP